MNELQPDVALAIDSFNCERTRVANERLDGLPMLVIEVAEASRDYELTEKKSLYESLCMNGRASGNTSS